MTAASKSSSSSTQPFRKFDCQRIEPAQQFEARPRIEPLKKGPVHHGKDRQAACSTYRQGI